MSETTAPAADLTVVEQEKKSFLSKLNPVPAIKKHPKIATAIGLGVALVAGAALFGKEEILPEPDNSIKITEHEDGSFTVSPNDEI